jgi:hypothetical protein
MMKGSLLAHQEKSSFYCEASGGQRIYKVHRHGIGVPNQFLFFVLWNIEFFLDLFHDRLDPIRGPRHSAFRGIVHNKGR